MSEPFPQREADGRDVSATAQATRPLLEQLAARYGIAITGAQLLQQTRNLVYRIDGADGRSWSARICPVDPHARTWLEDELCFLRFVASSGRIVAPAPLANLAGDDVTPLSHEGREHLACIFSWVPGLPANDEISLPAMEQVGRIAATLHELARQFVVPERPGVFRGDYRYDRTLVQAHRDWLPLHAAAIGSERLALLERAIDDVLAALDRIGEPPQLFGLLHADFHLGNVIVHEDQVALIDFDQLGWGHYCYDLAVLLVELRREPETCAARWARFKAGYESIVALPFESEAELAPFVSAVHLAYLDWVYNAASPLVWQQQERWLPGTYAALAAWGGRHINEAAAGRSGDAHTWAPGCPPHHEFKNL